jgi:hypothetical protein
MPRLDLVVCRHEKARENHESHDELCAHLPFMHACRSRSSATTTGSVRANKSHNHLEFSLLCLVVPQRVPGRCVSCCRSFTIMESIPSTTEFFGQDRPP